MDVSAVIVVLVLTALSLGLIVWLEIYSRRKDKAESSDETQTRESAVLGNDSD